MPRIERRTALLALAATLFAVVGFAVLRGGDDGAPAPSTTAPPPEPPLVVHVAGAVRAPGLYHLDRGTRVADAVEAAGGPRRRAALDAVNLAAPLVDGQRIAIPFEPPAQAASDAASSGDAPGGPVSLSSADLEALDALPGVGPATAAEIIAWRDAHGGFAAVEDLERVPGIGPAKLEALRPLVAP